MNDSVVNILKRHGGYYQCPKDDGGQRLGPLVGYAATYGAADGVQRQYVGEAYYDFSVVEQYPVLLDLFAKELVLHELPQEIAHHSTVVVGAPMGGVLLAFAIGRIFQGRAIYAEKELFESGTDCSADTVMPIFSRHHPKIDEHVLIVEDVCSRFSTARKLINLVIGQGAHPIGVVCVVNRSGVTTVSVDGEDPIPVFSLVRVLTPQYKQDDPYVQEDVVAGNVVWHPKKERARLMSFK